LSLLTPTKQEYRQCSKKLTFFPEKGAVALPRDGVLSVYLNAATQSAVSASE